MPVRTPPVVVAVGARGSDSAVEYAASEALARGTGLHLVHAVDMVPTGAGSDVLAAAVHRATALVAGQVPVTFSLAQAPAVPAVVSVAGDAALVVVGRCPESRRTHPYGRSVTGGVAARVEAPVVSVPDGWEAPGGAPHVVAGVDDPEHGDVLATAVAAAQERHGRLTVLTAWWRPTGSTEGPLTQVDDSAWPERLRTDLDRALAHLAPDPGLPLELHIRNARPGDALIEASHGAQLLVLGRHDPLLPTGSHLGPVARTVLRGAACPILLAAPRHAHQVRHHDEPAMRPV